MKDRIGRSMSGSKMLEATKPLGRWEGEAATVNPSPKALGLEKSRSSWRKQKWHQTETPAESGPLQQREGGEHQGRAEGDAKRAAPWDARGRPVQRTGRRLQGMVEDTWSMLRACPMLENMRNMPWALPISNSGRRAMNFSDLSCSRTMR